MADDIKIKIGTEIDTDNIKKMKELLEELKKSAEQIPLGSEDATKVKKNISAAEKAFNAGDWDLFRSFSNKVTKTLTQAIASTGNISEALQKALDVKNKLEKQLNQLKERESNIKSKYSDESMSHFNVTAQDEAFKAFIDEQVKAGKMSKISFGSEKAYQQLQLAIQKAGSFQKINNEIAKEFQLVDKKTAGQVSAFNTRQKNEQAKDIAEVKTLQKSQQDLQNDIEEVDKEIGKLTPASEAAAKGLEELYKKIVNISSVLNKSVTTQKVEERQVETEQTGGGKASTLEEVGEANKALDKQQSTLGKVFKQWTLYNIALRAVKRAMREAIATVKELDKALTEQAMVTGLTRKQAYELLGTYQDMARSLGATTKEVASTMTAFLRQGRSIQEATELSNAAIAAAKVASISTADSVNYLTTAVNGFRLSAEDAMKVSDKFAAVAATAATSYEEIAIAMSKVASQANLAGMSIDYTTALLTKGLETTREAPETIGTALKTVIARMRELTDYGATLEDGMNINNVEKQLSYVSIELRNQNGELRSTEDVLNELGQKWDTLSSNQQAAIAKALAGTRQQSRLIAMMQDYDRVIELQEIAERSQGATLAQMSTYLEGMDAALNKVNIAWEKIVSTITDSDVIINFVNYIAGAMETIGDFLSTDWGLISTLTVAATIGTTILANKMQEVTYSKMQQEQERKLQIIKLKTRQIELERLIIAKHSNALQAKKDALLDLEDRIKKGLVTHEEAQLEREKIESDYMKEVGLLEQEHLANQEQLNLLGESNVSQYSSIAGTLGIISGGILSATTGSEAWLAVMTALSLLTKTIPPILDIIFLKQKRNNKQEEVDTAKLNALKGQGAAAKIISQLGVWGIPLAIATAAIFGVVLAIQAFNKTQLSDEERIEKMSASIYKLSEKSNKLDTVISKFDDLDKKIVKTNKDLEEMDSILQSVVDSLDEEQQKEYKALTTNVVRRDYLLAIQEETEKQLRKQREEQRKALQGTSAADISKSSSMKDALYALNNSYAYDEIDQLKLNDEMAASTRRLTQAMLEQLTVEQQQRLLTSGGSQKLKNYTLQMKNLAEALEKDNLTLTEQIKAYKKAYNALGNDAEAKAAFEKANKSWMDLGKFSSETLEYIDTHYKTNIDGINALSKAIKDLGNSYEDSAKYIDILTTKLQQGSSLGDAISSTFGFASDSSQFQQILNAYDKAFTSTISDISQNLTAFQNQINSFYDNAGKWGSMSEMERMNFISENIDLFKGPSGDKLRDALETGDYRIMQAALANNQFLAEQRQNRILEIEQKLLVEEERIGEERNEVYIQELKRQKALLEDVENLYLVSLETRLKQEETELNAYKDYLNKQKDALEDSLNKRKDAYQKYFDAINQEAEGEDYEDQAQTMITNLQKLASSNSATAEQQTKQLEQQLADLEKDRLKELRERAQEQVLNNMDTELQEINDKFDKLLESNQLLLKAMLDDTSDMQSFASNYLGTTLAGASLNQAESAIQTFETNFGKYFNGLGGITVAEDENGHVIVNIGNQTIDLTANEGRDVIASVMRALAQQNINTSIR